MTYSQTRMWRFFQEYNAFIFSASGPRTKWLFRQATKRYGRSYIHTLNIGIGNGWLEEWCQKQGWYSHAVDIVPETVVRIRERGIDAICVGIDSLPYEDGSMDVVFCSEVLEHLTQEVRTGGLREIRRILRPGGVLIGTTPINELLAGNTTCCPDCGTVFHSSGHLISFTKQTQREELERHGFRVIKQYTSAFLDWSTQRWYGKVAMIPFWAVGRMGRGFAIVICGFVAKKDEIWPA